MKRGFTITGAECKELRHKLKLNQSVFWAKVFAGQSLGSRYERGRDIPRPTQELLRLSYIEGLDCLTLNADEALVGKYLRAKDVEQFKALRKEAKQNGGK